MSYPVPVIGLIHCVNMSKMNGFTSRRLFFFSHKGCSKRLFSGRGANSRIAPVRTDQTPGPNCSEHH